VAAAVLLLSAPHAFASRTAPGRPELLAAPVLQPITATQVLAPTYAPQGFALHLDTDPHPARFALFDDLAPASAPIEPEKLASGVESWDLTPNIQRIQIFVAESWQVREFLGPIDSPNLYQAFGLDPMNMTDPLGLEATATPKGNFVIADARPGARGQIHRIPAKWARENPGLLFALLCRVGNLRPTEALALMEKHGVQIRTNSPEVIQVLAMQMQIVEAALEDIGKVYAAAAATIATAGTTAAALGAAGATASTAASVGLFAGGMAGLGTSDAIEGQLSDVESYLTAGAVTVAGGWIFEGGSWVFRGSGPAMRTSYRSGVPKFLRYQYEKEVRSLADVALAARATGADPETVARLVHQIRRDLGVKYKAMTPPDELARITARNIREYGDPLGPNVDWLRARGKSWDEIIEGAARPGGKDLRY
jgi:hypothetical protein